MTASSGSAKSWRRGLETTAPRTASFEIRVSAARELAALFSSARKSERMRLPTTWPRTRAKPIRITMVSPAVVTAIRHRTGIRSKKGSEGRARSRVTPQPCASSPPRRWGGVGGEEGGVAVRFEVAPEIGDEDVDGVGLLEGVVAPYVLEQPLAGDDQLLVPGQVLEQLELAVGQVDVAGATLHLAGVGI